MNIRTIAAASAFLVAGFAQAASPTATIVSSSVPGISFAQYTGSTTIGEGLLNSDTLYFVDEKSGVAGDSWYIFFEPNYAQSVTAVITFDTPITAIYTTQGQLAASAGLQAPGLSYSYSNAFVGLEGADTVTSTAYSVTISWNAKNPGDHIRVTTAAVPEPETYALMAAGLLAVGFAAKRRTLAGKSNS